MSSNLGGLQDSPERAQACAILAYMHELPSLWAAVHMQGM